MKDIVNTTILSLKTLTEIQEILSENVRTRRLQLNLTQKGLSERSGVHLSTLRKFEQQGVISLESFLKHLTVLGMLEPLVKATEVQTESFNSIDEVIALNSVPTRKRGRRT